MGLIGSLNVYVLYCLPLYLLWKGLDCSVAGMVVPAVVAALAELGGVGITTNLYLAGPVVYVLGAALAVATAFFLVSDQKARRLVGVDTDKGLGVGLAFAVVSFIMYHLGPFYRSLGTVDSGAMLWSALLFNVELCCWLLFGRYGATGNKAVMAVTVAALSLARFMQSN